jgi:hydrogenase nickel incorporation protein HypA/HybF
VHELSIALSILDVAEEEAERRGGVHVEAIHFKLGTLSGLVKRALISAYELACEQTPFEGSRLIVEEVPVVVYCVQCQAERPVHSLQRFCCAACDTPASPVLQGRELQLAALELADD